MGQANAWQRIHCSQYVLSTSPSANIHEVFAGLKAEYTVTSLVEEMPAAGVADQETCSLENYLALPDHTMDSRIAEARAKLGSQVLLLGHHYQRDEVIRFADYTGDSYKLSKIASQTDAKYIIFCGVHFMAESADLLGRQGR